MRILLTGAAGFIGFHTSKALLMQGHTLLGFDSINDYYDPSFKYARLEFLKSFDKFTFIKGNIEDSSALRAAWDKFQPDHVIHLAAQAGVRYSIENPMAYIKANIVGFQNMIELVRERKPLNFLYASSSSVYGGNKILPFSESQDVSNPVSLYAATKLSNELVAKSYGNLFHIPSTGFRFFTVYGPFSRPDMAMFKFAELMRDNKPIPVFNQGNMIRDFTFVEDIVSGLLSSLPRPDVGQVYNLGKGAKNDLLEMIRLLEENLGIKAKKEMLPMQAGDVEATIADISKARTNLGYEPKTDLVTGVKRFAEWYRSFRNF